MYKFFSVDDHIIEPADVWSSRVPSRYRDVAPHIVVEDGREYWEYEDRRHDTFGLNAVVGKPREEWATDPVRFDDMIRGCWDPAQRARDLRSQGIYASVNFPTLPRFGGALFAAFHDKDLALHCVRAWNDFVIDEWCAADPAMFVPMVICPIWDSTLAEAEIRRCIDKGAKALCFVEDPYLLELPSLHDPDGYWDPVFGICQEAQLPVCMHIGSSGSGPIGTRLLDPNRPTIVPIATAFTAAASASVNMMFSPIPRRFPDIRLVWSEGGIGWVPAALERADRQWERHLWSHADDIRPSDIARRNMWFCMIEEPIGLTYRHDFGVERILWESDYPHADCPYPDTQANADIVFHGVPPHEVDMITHQNAEALFDWELVVSDDAKVAMGVG